jgi:hypothetical protein
MQDDLGDDDDDGGNDEDDGDGDDDDECSEGSTDDDYDIQPYPSNASIYPSIQYLMAVYNIIL